MKRSQEEAKRWLSQAQYDIEVAKRMLEQEIYSYSCFLCEQAAQKALKAYLYFEGKRYVWEHSVQELAGISREYDEKFEGIIEAGKLLDRYYIPTRYPDALALPALPQKTYNEKDASQAVSLAEKIIRMVKGEIKKGEKRRLAE